MKVWKRNAIVATVLVLVCAGVYLNWNASNQKTVDLTETLNAEQVMGSTVITMPDMQQPSDLSVTDAVSDQFAQIRLSRQESRDSAVELLQEAMAYEEGSEGDSSAAASLDMLVGDALAEAQIESLVIAKGFADCVAYMTDEVISIAVSSPEEGLSETDVAMISDIVTSQSDYDLSDLRIIEVK